MSQFKKKIKPGLIDLDPIEPVIIVNFVTQTVDTTQTGDDGKPLVIESIPDTKRMRLKTFHAGSTISKFAEAIQKQTNLIHESKIPRIAELLEILQQRLIAQGEEGAGEGDGGDSLANTAPAPIRLAAAGGSSSQQRDSSLHGGSSGGYDLRASAPTMSVRAMRKNADADNEDGEDVRARFREEEGKTSDEYEAAPARPVRPGSAARSRAAAPAATSSSSPQSLPPTSPLVRDSREGSSVPRLDINSNGSPNPQAALSPTVGVGATGGSSALSKSQQKLNKSTNNGASSSSSSSSSNTASTAQYYPSQELTPAELEAQELAAQERRAREERMSKEQRRMKNQKRSEQMLAALYKLEQERLVIVEKREQKKKKEVAAEKKKKEVASLKKLDSYMETLYDEDIQTKVTGTNLILQLVQHHANLDYFIDHDTILGALARVLTEDRKKSVELSTNILEIFFCFSSFRQLHPILLSNKIGDTTMKIIDLEMKRYELRREKEEKWRREHLNTGKEGQSAQMITTTNTPSQGDITTHYLLSTSGLSSDEKDRIKKLTSFLQSQERLLFVCFYILLNLSEDFVIEMKMKNRGIIRYLIAILKRTGTPLQEDRAFLDELHLLIITFLKKLSIFDENKREMKSQGIVEVLEQFVENGRRGMVVPGNIGGVGVNTSSNLSNSKDSSALTSSSQQQQPYDTSNPEILDGVLKLLYNLSFDPEIRRDLSLLSGGIHGGWVIPRNFGKAGKTQIPVTLNNLPPNTVLFGGANPYAFQTFWWEKELNPQNLIVKCVDFLKKPNNAIRIQSLRILYNLSTDLVYRPLIERAVLPDITLLTNMLLRTNSKLCEKELIGLIINLTWNEECIDTFLTPDILYSLIKRIHQTFDSLLIKLLRNISSFSSYHILFKKHLHELVGMMIKAPSHDFLLESLGILSNITIYNDNIISYSDLIQQHGLLDFIMTHIQIGFNDDDILLECIKLLGTLAIDSKSARLLSNTKLIRTLFELLNEKIEDLDIVIQIVYTIFKFLLHQETRKAVMEHQYLTHCLLDLVVDPSSEVRYLSNMCLDIIMDHDVEWREKIREKRFEAFNKEWLQCVGATSASVAALKNQNGNVHLHHPDGLHDSRDDDDLSGGGGYDHSLGLHGGALGADDSMDSQTYAAYHGHHDPMGELGTRGGMLDDHERERYHDEMGMEDSEDNM